MVAAAFIWGLAFGLVLSQFIEDWYRWLRQLIRREVSAGLAQIITTDKLKED